MLVNWYQDGKNIETLIGGASVVALQVFNVWRSVRNARGIEAVRSLVTHNDEQIIADLTTAQNSLSAIRTQLGADRRRPVDPAAPTFVGGRRSTDLPA